MMRLSKNATRIEESITMAITAKAKALKAQGIDVISLSAGEPDFDTPQHIKDAAIRAIEEGFTKYTAATGIPELKKAICEKFYRDNGLEYEPSQIVVTCGAKHAIFDVVMALINEGDEAIIPSPYWVSYADQVKLMGGIPVVIDTLRENGLKLTPEALEEMITPRTKFLLLNSPSNPHGAVYSEWELRALAEVILDAEMFVISDEIYEKIIYGDARHVSIASFGPELKDRTIVVNGVSKSYSMTGWRIGYAAGPKRVMKVIGDIESQETSNPCSISQRAALAGLTGPQECVEEMRQAFEERREYVIGRLNGMEGVTCPVPDGAFYAFPDVSTCYGRTIRNSAEMCSYLLEEHRVACVPGSGFGMDDYIRLSYAASMDDLRRGLDRIEEGLKKLL
jgi:aspartate aminotransferase